MPLDDAAPSDDVRGGQPDGSPQRRWAATVQLDVLLRAAAVPTLHRRLGCSAAPSRRRSSGSHMAVTSGGVWVIEQAAWHWLPERRGAAVVEGLDAAVAALVRHTGEVEEALAPLGLAPGEIRPLLVSEEGGGTVVELGRVWLVGTDRLVEVLHARGARLEAATQATVLEHLAEVFCTPAAGSHPAEASPATVADAPAGAWAPRPLDLTSVAAGGPVEPWMTGLHADQMRAVRRCHRGPALVRGAPGTGKTVVALHRAAYLAERHPGRVLVTTPVRALVGVLASQYRRLSPTTTGRVEFATFHGFALRVLAGSGIACNVDPFGLDAAFRRAWDRLGGSGLGAWAPPGYWRDEIGTVIKGRGIERFDQYLQAQRPGRTVPLSSARRRGVWQLHLAYTDELARRDLQDWYDVVRLARDCVRERPPAPPYRAVIADEIGELPVTGLQLLHALVRDRSDGLLLVGDCAATSELGAVRLEEAGVDVAGRSTVMRNVYRDNRRLLEAAVAVVPAPDEEPEVPLAVAGDGPVRDGKPVRHDVAPDRETHDRRLLLRLREDLAEGAADLAVLCHTDRAAEHYRRLLRSEGLPVASLGRGPVPGDVLEVGTVSAARDRDFAAVYLPAGEPLRAVRDPDQVRYERQLRFAAMTAARDRLWVGTLDPPLD